MTFSFEKKATVAKPALDVKTQGYRDRAKAEAERYNNAIEIDLWLCMCFQTLDQLGAWQTEFGFGEPSDRYWVPDVDWEPWRPLKLRRGFSQDSLEPKVYPPAPPDTEDSGSLENDCFTWLETVRQSFLSIDEAAHEDSDSCALQSGVYIVLVFPSMADKEDWVKKMNLSRFGKKYMDGTAVLDVLRRNNAITY